MRTPGCIPWGAPDPETLPLTPHPAQFARETPSVCSPGTPCGLHSHCCAPHTSPVSPKTPAKVRPPPPPCVSGTGSPSWWTECGGTGAAHPVREAPPRSSCVAMVRLRVLSSGSMMVTTTEGRGGLTGCKNALQRHRSPHTGT